jgi:hypothetical protein
VVQLAIVRGAMIVATVAWAAGEALMRGSAESDRLARAAWTIGIVFAAIHVGLAFQWVYHWNHEAAVEATVKQAAARFGWGWRGGIYVNYVFLAMWLADVSWWWMAPATHATRPLQMERARLVFFTFMFLNGAVIFASGIGRLAGIASVTLAIFGAVTRRQRWSAA